MLAARARRSILILMSDSSRAVDTPTPESELFDLAQRLGAACLARGTTVAVAESCTGGLIAHAITEISGSSGYFQGGIVAYSDEAKRTHLGVPAAILAAHGAVSVQTARAMAEGVRHRFAVDVAASVTGVAGPGGGTDAKPVGLTYVAIADADGVDVRRLTCAFDRSGNKRASAAAVLRMLLERIEAHRPLTGQ